ncbi:uncharacterized protein LOC110044548 [Orbicella faveolata]|uniref:uncharacterized protein LOC110044548 n=1 Tax=Orbicella faveolata TaxID=48498 RepID=UPI0009E31444|nr:uncharacterized protein LOC110044548 [Orbicella faveolata]
MSARGVLVFMVALLSFVLGASIKESGENLSEQAECRGACSLARDERSRTGVKVLRALSCKHCLNRRKGKQWLQERTKDRLFFIATTFTKRHRRSIFLDPSLPTSSTALKPSDCVASSEDNSVPEMVIPSKVDVAFGQYENTSYWYVNVSWTPMNDSSGHLYGALLSLALNFKNDVNCTVLRMNQTFLNINISFYGYSYPGPVYLWIHGLPYRKKVMETATYYPSKFELLHVEPNGQ